MILYHLITTSRACKNIRINKTIKKQIVTSKNNTTQCLFSNNKSKVFKYFQEMLK